MIHDSYIIVKVALWSTETNLQLFKTAQSFPTSFPPAGYPALDTGRFYTGYIKEGLQDILQLTIFGITLCHRCNILFLNTKQQTHIHTHTCGNTTKFLFLVSEPAKVLSESNNIFSKVLPLFCSDPKKLFTFWMPQNVTYDILLWYCITVQTQRVTSPTDTVRRLYFCHTVKTQQIAYRWCWRAFFSLVADCVEYQLRVLHCLLAGKSSVPHLSRKT